MFNKMLIMPEKEQQKYIEELKDINIVDEYIKQLKIKIASIEDPIHIKLHLQQHKKIDSAKDFRTVTEHSGTGEGSIQVYKKKQYSILLAVLENQRSKLETMWRDLVVQNLAQNQTLPTDERKENRSLVTQLFDANFEKSLLEQHLKKANDEIASQLAKIENQKKQISELQSQMDLQKQDIHRLVHVFDQKTEVISNKDEEINGLTKANKKLQDEIDQLKTSLTSEEKNKSISSKTLQSVLNEVDKNGFFYHPASLKELRSLANKKDRISEEEINARIDHSTTGLRGSRG